MSIFTWQDKKLHANIVKEAGYNSSQTLHTNLPKAKTHIDQHYV
jgi:hypothetical protein